MKAQRIKLLYFRPDRWAVSTYGYTAFGTTPERALRSLYLFIAWSRSPNGWRSFVARLRWDLHRRFAF